MEHTFTNEIKQILNNKFGDDANEIFNAPLIQYINLKTRSANKGSKSRGSFANLYAIYVIIEDYLAKEYDKKGGYTDYEGASYKNLFVRQRQLPFGNNLQNHGLNSRMNSEFQKFFPTLEFIPILRNHETNKYWINENLIKIKLGDNQFNIAPIVIEIINKYASTKQDALQRFIKACEDLQKVENLDPNEVFEFISSLLAPNVDARLFEIVSYSILKFFYHEQNIFWGVEIDNLKKENLILYKTGRTNANDGGIDFVMKPLGRFFQVTETLDFRKYFLDIDKVQKFPITFVVKSNEPIEGLKEKIKGRATEIYTIKEIIEKYLESFEEIINIPILKERFQTAIELGYLNKVLDEIIIQSKVEFNYSDLLEDEIESDDEIGITSLE